MSVAILAISVLLTSNSVQGKSQGQTSAKLNKYYEAIAPELKVRKAAWDTNLAKLKDVSKEFYPGLQIATEKAGFDVKKLAENAKEAASQVQTSSKGDPSWLPNVLSAMSYSKISGIIDLTSIKQAHDKYFELVPDQTKHDKVTKIQSDEQHDILFGPPFTGASLNTETARYQYVRPNTGEFFLGSSALDAQSGNTIGSFRQAITIPAGTRQVRLVAEFNSSYLLRSAAFSGYASTEAILNLHAMSGSRILGSDRQSLVRLVSVALGAQEQSGHASTRLTTSFLVNPTLPPDVDAVADVEIWTGAGGLFATASAVVDGNLVNMHVYFDR